jgi:aspartate kinase
MPVEKVKIGGILQSTGLASIGVTGIVDRPGVASRLFQTLAKHRINVEFIAHAMDERGCSHVAFCVEQRFLQEAVSLLEQIRHELGFAEIVPRRGMGIVSVFGPHFRERHGLAGTFFNALSSARINILSISTSISTISCVIPEDDLPMAVAALSQAFDLPGG